MLAKLFSGAVIGLAGILIEIEVDVANRGFPTFTIVGLPNKAIDEAKDRVRTAIVNSSLEMPDSRITVNLAPADIPKMGSGFDLPIALGVLAASGKIDINRLKNSLFIGELSLYGQLRPVPGVISIALIAKEKGIEQLFLSKENALEAASIEGVKVFPVESLNELILHINNKQLISQQQSIVELPSRAIQYDFDFNEVRGQMQAKRALQIAAAGFHNVHLRGVPGAGKTMLCRAFPSILPVMSKEEILEVSQIYSAVNLSDQIFCSDRPYRSPHHTISKIGLIGGGAVPTPGEISLAHRGTLFLDEFSEFPRSTLEALRQPLENGSISISRAAGSLTFPCRFLLLAASNPCPCGYYGHPKKKCNCSQGTIFLYKKKISGPLLDRIELHIEIMPVEEENLIRYKHTVSSKELRETVMQAKQLQERRFKGTHIHNNSEMTPAEVRKYCHITNNALDSLKTAISTLNLSARSYFRVIKVAQTIADLTGKDKIEVSEIAEAIQYRIPDD